MTYATAGADRREITTAMSADRSGGTKVGTAMPIPGTGLAIEYTQAATTVVPIAASTRLRFVMSRYAERMVGMMAPPTFTAMIVRGQSSTTGTTYRIPKYTTC